jgi:hypothetical protein
MKTGVTILKSNFVEQFAHVWNQHDARFDKLITSLRTAIDNEGK